MDKRQLAREERAQLLDLLETLSPDQWETPSLCAGWRVRDVVAHMFSHETLDWLSVIRRFAQRGFRVDGVNAIGVAAYRTRSIDELLALVRAHVTPRGFTAAFGGTIALTDAVIHQQDIRRPLALPRDIPAERLLPALQGALAAPVTGARRRARGLRLVATDLDWSAGRGREVRGGAEALLMAVTGRPGVADELTGPGQPVLAARAS
jgi:uncharacterized protein (TIGR03083 family)